MVLISNISIHMVQYLYPHSQQKNQQNVQFSFSNTVRSYWLNQHLKYRNTYQLCTYNSIKYIFILSFQSILRSSNILNLWRGKFYSYQAESHLVLPFKPFVLINSGTVGIFYNECIAGNPICILYLFSIIYHLCTIFRILIIEHIWWSIFTSCVFI